MKFIDSQITNETKALDIIQYAFPDSQGGKQALFFQLLAKDLETYSHSEIIMELIKALPDGTSRIFSFDLEKYTPQDIETFQEHMISVFTPHLQVLSSIHFVRLIQTLNFSYSEMLEPQQCGNHIYDALLKTAPPLLTDEALTKPNLNILLKRSLFSENFVHRLINHLLPPGDFEIHNDAVDYVAGLFSNANLYMNSRNQEHIQTTERIAEKLLTYSRSEKTVKTFIYREFSNKFFIQSHWEFDDLIQVMDNSSPVKELIGQIVSEKDKIVISDKEHFEQSISLLQHYFLKSKHDTTPRQRKIL